MAESGDDFETPRSQQTRDRFGGNEVQDTGRNRDAAGFLRKHLPRHLLEARSIRDEVTASAMGEELLSRFPTLSSQRARRQRRFHPEHVDRRKNSCLRIRFTALDRPNISTTSNINLSALIEKNLGRRNDTTDQFSLEMTHEELCKQAVNFFPVLDGIDIQLFIGWKSSRLEEIPESATVKSIKQNIPKNSFARIWVRPTVLIAHVQMDTPTVLARPTENTSQRRPVSRRRLSSRPNRETEAATVPPLSSLDHTNSPFNSATILPSSAQPLSINETETDTLPDLHNDTPIQFTEEQVSVAPTLLDVESIGIEAMKSRVQGPLQTIIVRRHSILKDMFSLYKDGIDLTRPLYVTIEGEEGEDYGGIMRDALSEFWEQVFNNYFHGERSCSPFIPPNKRKEARELFSTIGKALEHFLGINGRCPLKFSKFAMLTIANPDIELEPNLLLEDFLHFIPEPDSDLLTSCLKNASWSAEKTRLLQMFYSVHKMSSMPKPETLKTSLIDLAQVEIIDRSLVFLKMIRNGISDFALNAFFCNLNSGNLTYLYAMYEPSKEKVIGLYLDLVDDTDMTPPQECAVYFLITLVRDFTDEQLRHFLRWITGSPSMPERVALAFNSTTGPARHPIAHTCSNLLELSETYETYKEFKTEMMCSIFSEEAFRYTMI